MKEKFLISLCILFLCFDSLIFCQNESLLEKKLAGGTVSLGIYGDFGYVIGPQKDHTYYDFISKDSIYDFGRRDFTSYPLYANSFSMAYGYLQTQFEIENKLKLRFAFHAGHIVDALYTEEMQSMKWIREMSLTYYFHKKLFAEIGIFPSYYGAEIVLSKENLHATRAYIADFTPDYEAGIRLHFKATEKLTFRGFLLNGWQEIKDLNGKKAIGLGLNFSNPKKINFDWHLYFGDESPLNSTIKKTKYRFYSNSYAKIFVGKRLIFFPVLDFVLQENGFNHSGFDFVVSPAASVRYRIGKNYGFAGRYEYLYNPNDIVPELKTNSPNGWQSHSFTATLEFSPIPQIIFRLEGRYGFNKDAVFRNSINQMVKEDYYGILSFAFQL